MREQIPVDMQGRIFSTQATFQFFTIPAGYLLGGILADYIFEPWMAVASPMQSLTALLVGSGKGSGIALIFLLTGIIGFCVNMAAVSYTHLLGPGGWIGLHGSGHADDLLVDLPGAGRYRAGTDEVGEKSLLGGSDGSLAIVNLPAHRRFYGIHAAGRRSDRYFGGNPGGSGLPEGVRGRRGVHVGTVRHDRDADFDYDRLYSYGGRKCGERMNTIMMQHCLFKDGYFHTMDTEDECYRYMGVTDGRIS